MANSNRPRTLRDVRDAYNARSGAVKLTEREGRVHDRAKILMGRAEELRLRDERRAAASEKRKAKKEKDQRARDQLGVGVATQMVGFSHSQKAMKNAMESFVVKKRVAPERNQYQEKSENERFGKPRLDTVQDNVIRADDSPELQRPADGLERSAIVDDTISPHFEINQTDGSVPLHRVNTQIDPGDDQIDESILPNPWSDMSIPTDLICEERFGPKTDTSKEQYIANPSNPQVNTYFPTNDGECFHNIPNSSLKRLYDDEQGQLDLSPARSMLPGLEPKQSNREIPDVNILAPPVLPLDVSQPVLDSEVSYIPTQAGDIDPEDDVVEDDLTFPFDDAAVLLIAPLGACLNPEPSPEPSLIQTLLPGPVTRLLPAPTPASTKASASATSLFENNPSFWLETTSQIEKDLACVSSLTIPSSPERFVGLLSRAREQVNVVTIDTEPVHKLGSTQGMVHSTSSKKDEINMNEIDLSLFSSSFLTPSLFPTGGDLAQAITDQSDQPPDRSLLKKTCLPRSDWLNQMGTRETEVVTAMTMTNSNGSVDSVNLDSLFPTLPTTSLGEVIAPNTIQGSSVSKEQPGFDGFSDFLVSENDFDFSSSELRDLDIFPPTPSSSNKRYKDVSGIRGSPDHRTRQNRQVSGSFRRRQKQGRSSSGIPSLPVSVPACENKNGSPWGGIGLYSNGDTAFAAATTPTISSSSQTPVCVGQVQVQVPTSVEVGQVHDHSRLERSASNGLGLGLSTQALADIFDDDDDDCDGI